MSWAAFGEVEWIPIDVYRRAAELNLLGAIRLSQVFLPSIRKSKGEYQVPYSCIKVLKCFLNILYCFLSLNC